MEPIKKSASHYLNAYPSQTRNESADGKRLEKRTSGEKTEPRAGSGTAENLPAANIDWSWHAGECVICHNARVQEKPYPHECHFCHDAGWLRRDDLKVGEKGFGKLVECECQHARRIVATRESLSDISSMIPSEQFVRLVDLVLEGNPGTTEMYRALQDILDLQLNFLTVWGGTGNGKTRGMQALVNESIDAGNEAIYITAYDLIGHIREAFNETPGEIRSASAYERIHRMEDVQVLCIDELDKLFPLTPWEHRQFTELIDVRYRNAVEGGQATVLAMNSSPETLDPHLRSRIMDKRFRVVENRDADKRVT